MIHTMTMQVPAAAAAAAAALGPRALRPRAALRVGPICVYVCVCVYACLYIINLQVI